MLRAAVDASNSAGLGLAASNELGPVQPTKAAIIHALGGVLAVRGRGATRRALLKAGGYRLTFAPPGPGALTVTWRTRNRHRSVAVGGGGAHSHTSGAVRIEVRLSATGRRLLRRSGRHRVTAVASFTPLGGVPVTRTATFEIR
jgi:hypothetical protein